MTQNASKPAEPEMPGSKSPNLLGNALSVGPLLDRVTHRCQIIQFSAEVTASAKAWNDKRNRQRLIVIRLVLYLKQAMTELKRKRSDSHFEDRLEGFAAGDATAHKSWRAAQDFIDYTTNNMSVSPSYGERYRYGENHHHVICGVDGELGYQQVMVKIQQMCLTQEGVQLVILARIKMLNEEL